METSFTRRGAGLRTFLFHFVSQKKNKKKNLSSCGTSWRRRTEHQTLFQRIPWLNDPQACVVFVAVWFSQGEFLVESSSSGSHRFIRSSPRRRCVELCAGDLGSPTAPPLGGLGLMSAQQSRGGAHWASWADCIRMVKER